MTAPEILAAAAGHIADRAATYDKQPAAAEAPKGERSAAKTAAAFNAVTGHALTPGDVYLLLAVLKMVRARQGDFKMDNYEDGAAYFALAGEQDQTREEKPAWWEGMEAIVLPPVNTAPDIGICQCGERRMHGHQCPQTPTEAELASPLYRWGPYGGLEVIYPIDQPAPTKGCILAWMWEKGVGRWIKFQTKAWYYQKDKPARMADQPSAPLPVVSAPQNDPVPNVWWMCPHCRHDHAWNWPSAEASDTGPTTMICDECAREVPCTTNGDGYFISAPK